MSVYPVYVTVSLHSAECETTWLLTLNTHTYEDTDTPKVERSAT